MERKTKEEIIDEQLPEWVKMLKEVFQNGSKNGGNKGQIPC
jgi:hypothetical protein